MRLSSCEEKNTMLSQTLNKNAAIVNAALKRINVNIQQDASIQQLEKHKQKGYYKREREKKRKNIIKIKLYFKFQD